MRTTEQPQEASRRETGESKPVRTTAPISRILVATDLSPLADHAVAFAISLATQINASLSICYVCEPAPPSALEATGGILQPTVNSEEIMKAAQIAIKRDIDRYSTADSRITAIVREGDPATEILSIAHEIRADLIVMGAHDRGTLSRLFFHSETLDVIGRASVPVLVVKDVSKADSNVT